MTDRDALTTGTHTDPDNAVQQAALLDYLHYHDPREAARRAVLLRPGDDAARLAWAEELERGAGDRACPACSGEGCAQHGHGDQSNNCRGTGRVPDGSAALGEFVRLGVESAAIERRHHHECIGTITRGVETRPLRSRVAALLPVVRAAGWFDVPNTWATIGMTRPSLRSDGAIVWEQIMDGVRCDITATISRGLPAKITCSAAAWLAVAAAVCERFPIETVEIVGAEPWHNDHVSDASRYQWYDGDRKSGVSGIHPQSDIPSEIFSLLGGYDLKRDSTAQRGYPTASAAVLALSAAAVRLGRYLAGLPALTGAPARSTTQEQHA